MISLLSLFLVLYAIFLTVSGDTLHIHTNYYIARLSIPLKIANSWHTAAD